MKIPLNISWQQILLHLFNFSILAGGLYFLLYKPVKSFMDGRAAHYAELDAAAEEKLARAETLEAEHRRLLEGAESEIMHMKAEAALENERAAAAQLETARKQSEKLLLDARTAAQKERQILLAEAQEEISALAIEAAKKVIVSSSDIYDRFLDAAESEGEQQYE